MFWQPRTLSNPIPQGLLQIPITCTASHSGPPGPPVCRWRSNWSQPLAYTAERNAQVTNLVEAKPTLKGSYYKISVTYLWIWLRQKAFWYCKIVQFILVWMSKPTLIKNNTFRWTQKTVKDKILMLNTRDEPYISSVCSWVRCWWMKSARAAGTSRSSGLSLRICLLVKSTIGEILSQLTYGNGRWIAHESEKYVLHDGRGFIALGLMKILGINGVLLLSTFSLNFSWGLATFLAWSSRNISERLPEPKPW